MRISGAVRELISMLGPDKVLHEPEDLLTLGYDATPGAPCPPEVVVYPVTQEQVAAALAVARREGWPVVPRGSGTGLSGGSVPVRGGMVLSLTRMNRILRLDRENLTATAEAGVITLDLFNAAHAYGLFYPPDPGSQKISTLGGNVAENAGGLRGLKYGVTRDYVMALRGVLPDGSELRAGSACVKDVAGYGLKDLWVGSEGTLGIVTEITVSLIPAPAARRTLLAFFRDTRNAGEAVANIVACGIVPSTMEIMDRMTIRCVEAFARIGLPQDSAALLLVEVDGHPAAVADEADAVRRELERAGATDVRCAEDAAEADRLAEARRTALSALARVSATTLLEDATVPRSRLAALLQEIERLSAVHGLKVGTFGHAGDGNLHPTVLCDERDADEMKRAHAFFDDLYGKVLEWGGTVSGEHGIGMAKIGYLERQVGAGGIRVMRRIKRAFDPEGLMNPGKIFRDGPGDG